MAGVPVALGIIPFPLPTSHQKLHDWESGPVCQDGVEDGQKGPCSLFLPNMHHFN